ncbi:MAG: translation initiation factor IF-2 [Deltaproteobacteria bacterium]|nr:translation initiation factor IF-2 [Deltaproteobacteria bacterium]
MAKIRVYELARDLNMTNNELIEKLNHFGYSVVTHTNTLEEEAASEFKRKLQKKPTGLVEETRVKPTVIRRRKKAKKEAPPQEKPDAELTSVPEEMPEAIAQPVPPAPPAEEPESKEPVETATPSERPIKSVPKPRKKGKPKKPAEKKRRKKEASAKIIKLGPIPAPAEPSETITPKEKAKKRKVPDGKPADVTPISVKLKDIKRKPPVTTAKPKIILDKKEVAVKEKKKKSGKKKPDEENKDIRFFKKKTSFRKKAIVEGKDLYSKENRVRKLRKGEKAKRAAKGQKPKITTPKAIKRRIKIDETIVLSDLAKRMGIKATEIIKTLMDLGTMATVNQTIDFDTAVLVAAEFDYEVEKASFAEESILKVVSDDPDKLVPRPPIVTVMGHVDHGKTSLLDVIRKTNVTEQEAGGITQHIGAYHVNTDRGQIVFLDTPGHEAFTAMRSRGASITDIVILVVAADDGVMPQTIEAINHAKAANVPIIVAINKIDKPNAEPDRVQRELADTGLTPEDWGGDTIFINISAKQGKGIEDLLEMILLQTELMELKANPEKPANGHVVEAKLDSGRGPVATVLVQDGTLHTGESVVCGIHYGKIRALLDDRGHQIESAGPSMPAEIIGLTGVPSAGDEFIILADEKNAKQVSNHRIQKQRAKELARTERLNLENLFQQMQEGEAKDLNIIIKADVQGSIEALKDALVKLSNDEVKINIIHAATGTIAESDIPLAMVSDAIIIGFNVRPHSKVQALATNENVDIRYYNVIYNVIKDVQSAILGLMSSTFEEKVLGSAEVRETFHVPKIGVIAGCYITDGKIQRGQQARLIRDGVVLYEGKISSLRRFKDDVREVQNGFECGIGIENYNDIKIADIIECFYMEEIKPEI